MSKNLSLFQGLTALPTHFYLFTFGLTQSVMRAVAHRRTTAHGVRCGTSLNIIPRFKILADAFYRSMLRSAAGDSKCRQRRYFGSCFEFSGLIFILSVRLELAAFFRSLPDSRDRNSALRAAYHW